MKQKIFQQNLEKSIIKTKNLNSCSNLEKINNIGLQLSSVCHPTNYSFVVGKQEKNYLFDLDQASIAIVRSLALVTKICDLKGTILLVGTSSSSAPLIQKVGQITDQPFVNTQWIGGLLTNWKQIVPSIQGFDFRLLNIEKHKLKKKSKKRFEGLSTLNKFPDLLIVVNPFENKDAIHEAKQSQIPIISFLSFKEKLETIDYPIPISEESLPLIYAFFNAFVHIYQIRKKKEFMKITNDKYRFFEYSSNSLVKSFYQYSYKTIGVITL